MRAHPLTERIGVPLDGSGRLPVDDYLRVAHTSGVFAAGDVAAARMDDAHMSVMSCQHSRPMGRYAGYNVIADLLGQPMLPLRIPWYVTVLDLGPAGAVYTEGWDRRVVATGATAKATKRVINRERIYPPRTGDREALLAAAAPDAAGCTHVRGVAITCRCAPGVYSRANSTAGACPPRVPPECAGCGARGSCPAWRPRPSR